MQILSWLIAALFALATLPQTALAEEGQWSIVIHGGAGTIKRDAMTPEKDAEIRAALDRALDAGSEVLAAGGSSLDAVTAAITVLEDDPNFNAGKGAVFTWEETNSLDASIMRGDTLEAGAVAGASTTRNPILLARKVMEESPHVLLSGEGADQFARDQGLKQVKPDYFFTQHRFDSLKRHKARAKRREKVSQLDDDGKFGTVGAVAIDRDGVISAGTSTGGMTGKRWGRIGDSPIIGAGTYANAKCGLSATGSGEYFIRLAVAYRVCSQLERIEREVSEEAGSMASRPGLAAQVAQLAADKAITEVGELGGSGGVILLAPDGTPVWAFDTPGMYRGKATSDGQRQVAIYGDEE
ncbi:isoaspartyl peptidase/L-asparaginase family protein [Sphingomicrobium lutaoense]|uniref:Isoaspartyl peptidase n=1 Tax=Sphingomicrobium lutaoense TaxID=515949 RepID=A0A839Z5I5_9SPHN|nr:isoaspartyl peptidase/L-asparaginase [Sphingomicrobium lutaoense]MBB3764882.1 beta-aspartyl-peptidase (threonine type) [Sphingomicrobium lutaoense]